MVLIKELFDILNESDYTRVIDCLVIYPDQKNGVDISKGLLKLNEFKHYVQFYKYGIKLPEIELPSK